MTGAPVCEPDGHGDAAARSACAEGQSVGGASAASALGSNRNECPPADPDHGQASLDSRKRRRDRYAARAALWNASTLRSVRMCGRVIRQDESQGFGTSGPGVTVKRRAEGSCAGYGNLMACGSVWACPRCAAVITAQRSEELANAVRAAFDAGASCHLLTLTMRHTRKHSLDELWSALSTAWRATFGTTAWTGDRGYERKDGTFRAPRIGHAEVFGVSGTVRAVEVTHGSNGWHLHAHVLVVSVDGLAAGLADSAADTVRTILRSSNTSSAIGVDLEWLGRNMFAALMWQRWATGLARAGMEAPSSVGVDIRRIDDEGAEFVGRYLAKATYGAAVKIGAEIAGGANTKSGKSAGDCRNRTPFEVLRNLTEDPETRRWRLVVPTEVGAVVADAKGIHLVDVNTGEVKTVQPPGDWRIWSEYESASRGRAQLVWSRSRKELREERHRLWNVVLAARGASSEMTNEELADERTDGDVVVTITRNGWYQGMLRHPEWLPELLEAAEASVDRALEWIRCHDVETIATYPGWDARPRAA